MGTAAWTIVSSQDERAPVLPLNGRRSILAPWPAGSFCTTCGSIAEQGYVGPVTGRRAFFPDPRLVLVCRPCAMRAIGADQEGLDRHRCSGACTDRLHVDLVPVQSSVLALGEPAARAAAVAGPYDGTPWAVVDVSGVSRTLALACGLAPDSAAVGGLMALWIEIARPLDWSTAAGM
ncbi:MAG: hypothetical protein M0013_10860 [Actinomycetota bacterium]|jgi:hypothetical protein|nr:hypothetical protein [Actinomycetota bacterium]